ncbi:MAG: LysR substrate-binding domain-containing protein [Bdellovibrionaceae bacterium]|nr:LysR substrate-binding domain-containing protein [Pseudobdellovibrionaceae bacterium]
METMKSFKGVMVFVKVAETGSFSRAAKELEVSKSYISKQIVQLEYELGLNLFVRSTRKVSLTNLGHRYLESCKLALAHLEDAQKDILDIAQTPQGNLRVTLAGIFGEEYIAPVLIEMAKKYPKLKVELNFSSQVIDLIAEKFDIAIRIGHLQNSTLFAQKIASRVEYVVCSKNYLQTAPPLNEPKDLIYHNCLGERTAWTFKKRGKSIHTPVKGNFKSNNPRVIQKAALAGLGVARLPGSYTFEEIKKGKLIPVLESYSEDKKDIWIVTPTRNTKNINVRIFIEELKKHISNDYPNVYF